MPPTDPAPTLEFPDVQRPDTGTVLISPWLVPDARFQRPAADAVVDAWEAQPRPAAMLTLTTFLSTDGGHVLNYAQWTDDAAHREWVRTRRPAALAPVDAALPGIRRPGVVRYRHHRSHVAAERATRTPEFVVTPTFATATADAQRALADTVLGMLAEEPVPGLLGAHFHFSQDGRRVLNFGEWRGRSAWRAFADSAAPARLRAAIEALPGVAPAPAVPADDAAVGTPGVPAVPTYVPHRSLVNVPPPGRG
ncbi:antibiotic biosynthesis monooxygenase [Streptomyces sp. NPDC056149]|uniref:antibiotic biosynthesis monooxygenase n=1 Tax=unclassified Streptomyces TaxID=2593676 RepID=UPI00238109CB|nr:antibiotic biosynthesis monooxygenase [Streptomyces sp. WZ-12]